MAIPIAPFLSVLWNNKKLIATVIVVLALCGYIMMLKNEANDWQVKATTAEGTIKELNVVINSRGKDILVQQGSITTLETSLNKQTAAVRWLAEELKKKNVVIATMKAEAEKKKKENELQLQQILNEQKPKNCESTIDYLINGTGDLQWTK